MDIAVGQRSKREDAVGSRWASSFFWWLYRRLVQSAMPPGGVDVFACNQAVRDALLQMGESDSSLIGQLFWLGFRRTAVPYNRRQRPAGKSGWTLSKKVRYNV